MESAMASDCTRDGGGGAAGSQNEIESGCVRVRCAARSLYAYPDQGGRKSLYGEGGGNRHDHDGRAAVSVSENVRGGRSRQSLRGHHRGPYHEGGLCCDHVRDALSHGCGQYLPPSRVRRHGASEPPQLLSPVLSTHLINLVRMKRTGTAYLILLHLVLLHFEELARHAEGVFIALGADAEIPEFIDETRGIFVKETA